MKLKFFILATQCKAYYNNEFPFSTSLTTDQLSYWESLSNLPTTKELKAFAIKVFKFFSLCLIFLKK